MCFNSSDRLELPVFQADLLGPTPKFTKEMDKILLEFVEKQTGLFMDPEFIKWRKFPFDEVEYSEFSSVDVYLIHTGVQILFNLSYRERFKRCIANTSRRGIVTCKAAGLGFLSSMIAKPLKNTGVLNNSERAFSITARKFD
jgi:hypothetical protein